MSKKIIHIITFLLITSFALAQNVISSKSEAVYINLKPKYVRGLPPNLYVNLAFEDENKNGILEPNESALIKILISNKGKGTAQGLRVIVKDNLEGQELLIEDDKEIPYLKPDHSVEVIIPIKSNFNVSTAEHKLKIEVIEHFGYDMDPAYLVLNTLEYLSPRIVLSGVEVIDFGEGTAAINVDGQLEAGEQVKVKVMIQNIGKNISEETSYQVFNADKNVYIDDNIGNLGDILVGEVKSFWITVSPNKRVADGSELPIFLRIKNKHNIGGITYEQLPIYLNQNPPRPTVVEVEPIMRDIAKNVARFEFTSNKITANLAEVIDIHDIPESKTKRQNSVAVVIGVEYYKYFVNAPYATNDADIMEKYFKLLLGVDQVIVYKNDDINFFENIFNPFNGDLKKAIVSGQTELFVFYSGHGIPSKDGKKVYLLPSDGKITSIQNQGYELNKFYQDLFDLQAKTTTVFIDACFSGASKASDNFRSENLIATKGVVIKPQTYFPWSNNDNFNLFTSSSLNETSLAFDQSRTGLFTYYLCAGLQGKADFNGDKKITNKELSNYLSKKVRETSVKISGEQTPVFMGNPNYKLVEY